MQPESQNLPGGSRPPSAIEIFSQGGREDGRTKQRQDFGVSRCRLRLANSTSALDPQRKYFLIRASESENGAPGRRNRKEGERPTRGPECREPDTEETRALTWSTRPWDFGGGTRPSPVLAREGRFGGVIGEQPTRTKVKRRKAPAAGKPAISGEAQRAFGSCPA